jgi:ParB-like chromosome segregation protein Spo0J
VAKANNNRPDVAVTWVEIDQVTNHPDNPRDGDVGAIITSISQNGWYGALIVQKSTNFVLVGNHRLMAIRQLGWMQVPVIFLDVDDRRARNIMLADNKVSDKADYNEDALAALLSAAAADGDLLATGYDQDDVDALIASSMDAGPLDVEKSERKCPNCGHVLTGPARTRPR